MIALAVGRGAYRLGLAGVGSQAPFREACFPRRGAPGETIEEILDLGLEGSPAELQEGMAGLERWLAAARRQTGPGEEPVCLYLQENEGEISWSAPLYDGWVEKLKGQTSGRSLSLRLHLTRANYWEDAYENFLPLTSAAGAGLAVRVDNFNDAQHGNWVDCFPDDAWGDQPLPAVIRLKNTTPASLLGSLYIYMQKYTEPEGPFSGWLDAASASGGSLLADPAASGGMRRNFSWSGTEEQELCSWTLSAPDLLKAGGRSFQPVLRILPAPDGETRLRLSLSDGAVVLWSGPFAWLEAGQELQTLPTVQLPLNRMALEPMKPLALSLAAVCSQPGDHSLGLDYLHLAGLDGWRRLVPLGAGLATGSTLVDDARRGCVYQNAPLILADYAGMGPPLLLEPGRHTRLVFFQAGMDGTAPPGRTMEVSVMASRRFRRV